MNKKGKAPNCLRCKHFFITWEPQRPRGCKLFGFKGMMMPSMTVFQTTGQHCPKFEEKPKKK